MKKARLFSPINSLPSECISYMITLTSPRDACMFALASTGFRSVVDTDYTWQLFLPTDIKSILSRSVDPVVFSGKKDLVVKLCSQYLLIDGGDMSFRLDKSSGKICYMISATKLNISFADEPHWRWISPLDSRFSNVAEKMGACNLYIRGKVDRKALSPKTIYGAYLVYKTIETSNDDLGHPIREITLRTSVTSNNHIISQNYAHLVAMQEDVVQTFKTWQVPIDGAQPKERRDGWIEVEIGEFYNENGDDGEVEICLEEIYGKYWKGLIVRGMELKPKN